MQNKHGWDLQKELTVFEPQLGRKRQRNEEEMLIERGFIKIR